MTAPAANIGPNIGTPPMRQQSHGGALVSGNPHRNGGRRPQKIRKRALALLSKNLDVLDHIASGATAQFVEDGKIVLATPRPSERVAALKLLGELGMGANVGVQEIRSRLREQLDLIRTRPTWDAEDLVTALAAVWK